MKLQENFMNASNGFFSQIRECDNKTFVLSIQNRTMMSTLKFIQYYLHLSYKGVSQSIILVSIKSAVEGTA